MLRMIFKVKEGREEHRALQRYQNKIERKIRRRQAGKECSLFHCGFILLENKKGYCSFSPKNSSVRVNGDFRD